jgi:hypothetical protein
VRGVLPARVAEFLCFQPVGVLLPVLGGRVVPVFAIVALQRDDFSHGLLSVVQEFALLDVSYSMSAIQ